MASQTPGDSGYHGPTKRGIVAQTSSNAKPRPVPHDFEVVAASHAALRGGDPVALRMSDGVIICGEWFRGNEAPRAVVLLSHAMMVDRRTLDRPAGQGLLSALLAAGLWVLWIDQRGHGQSQPWPSLGARWDYDTLLFDVAALAAYLQQVAPDVPRVAVGHSLFGHLALAWQARSVDVAGAARFDGLVLLAANVWLRRHEPWRFRWLAKKLSYLALLWAARPLGYLPALRLGIGSDDEPYAYLAQMGSWVFSGDWADRHGHSFLAQLPRVKEPILSVAGAGDRLMAIPGCQLRFVSETSGPITHWQVGRRFGDPIDPDHMDIVRSSTLRPLFDDIAAWICTPGRFDKKGGAL